MKRNREGYKPLSTKGLIPAAEEASYPHPCDLGASTNIGLILCFIAIGIEQTICATPMNVYMVKKLGAEPSIQSTFLIISSIPWSLKLFFGFISDTYPIHGLKRKPYLLLGSILFSSTYVFYSIYMYFFGINNGKLMLAIILFIGGIGQMFVDVMCDTITVQRSKYENINIKGNLQATTYSFRFAGNLLGSIMGTFFANAESGIYIWGYNIHIEFYHVCFLNGILFFILTTCMLYQLLEKYPKQLLHRIKLADRRKRQHIYLNDDNDDNIMSRNSINYSSDGLVTATVAISSKDNTAGAGAGASASVGAGVDSNIDETSLLSFLNPNEIEEKYKQDISIQEAQYYSYGYTPSKRVSIGFKAVELIESTADTGNGNGDGDDNLPEYMTTPVKPTIKYDPNASSPIKLYEATDIDINAENNNNNDDNGNDYDNNNEVNSTLTFSRGPHAAVNGNGDVDLSNPLETTTSITPSKTKNSQNSKSSKKSKSKSKVPSTEAEALGMSPGYEDLSVKSPSFHYGASNILPSLHIVNKHRNSYGNNNKNNNKQDAAATKKTNTNAHTSINTVNWDMTVHEPSKSQNNNKSAGRGTSGSGSSASANASANANANANANDRNKYGSLETSPLVSRTTSYTSYNNYDYLENGGNNHDDNNNDNGEYNENDIDENVTIKSYNYGEGGGEDGKGKYYIYTSHSNNGYDNGNGNGNGNDNDDDDDDHIDNHELTIKKKLLILWGTIQLNIVWKPMMFIYFYNILQVPNVAWLSFQQLQLKFPPWFMGTTSICCMLFTLIGVLTFKYKYLKVTWKNIFLYTTIILFLLGIIQLFLINHSNRILGISDFTMSLFIDIFASFLIGIQRIPITILYMSLCPNGLESITYSLLTMYGNIANSVSVVIGGILSNIWDVSNDTLAKGDYNGLWKLALLTSILSLLPLILLKYGNILPSTYKEQLLFNKDKVTRSTIGGIFFVIIFTISFIFVIGRSISVLLGMNTSQHHVITAAIVNTHSSATIKVGAHSNHLTNSWH